MSDSGGCVDGPGILYVPTEAGERIIPLSDVEDDPFLAELLEYMSKPLEDFDGNDPTAD